MKIRILKKHDEGVRYDLPKCDQPTILLKDDWGLKQTSISNHQLRKVRQLITISNPGEVEPDYLRSFPLREAFRFKDATPESLTGRSAQELEELDDQELLDCMNNLAAYDSVDKILKLICKYVEEDYQYGQLILHSSSATGRASCFLIASYLIMGYSVRESVFKAARQYGYIRPNMWVCGLIDYIMRCKGQLTSVVEEMLITGIVVSQQAELVEMSWKDQVADY